MGKVLRDRHRCTGPEEAGAGDTDGTAGAHLMVLLLLFLGFVEKPILGQRCASQEDRQIKGLLG